MWLKIRSFVAQEILFWSSVEDLNVFKMHDCLSLLEQTRGGRRREIREGGGKIAISADFRDF